MPRLLLLLIAAAIVLMVAMQSPARATEASPSGSVSHAKKSCKYVTKRVHGKKKKVKVCKAVKPTATPRPTATPKPTPTPTATSTLAATATSTPMSTATPTSSPIVSSRFQQCQTSAGSVTIDSVQGIAVQVDAFQLGTLDNIGPYRLPQGDVFLFVRGTEALADPAAPKARYYTTGAWNFQLVDANGMAYKSSHASPPNAIEGVMQENVLSTLTPINSGWIEFQVPNRPGDYQVQWTSQDFHTPNWVNMGAQLHVANGQVTRESSLPPCALPFPVIPAASTALLTVHTWAVPYAIFHGSYPLLYIKTDAGATCSASLSYATSPSLTMFDGATQTASGTGILIWRWHELNVGTTGTATVTCQEGGQTASTTATFTIYN